MRNIRLYVLVALALLIIGAQLSSQLPGPRRVTGQKASSTIVLADDQLTPVVPSKRPGNNPTTPLPAPGDNDVYSTPPMGMPAIRPNGPSGDPGIPSVTDADVIAFASTHHTNGVTHFPSSVTPAIMSIRYLKESELQALLPNYQSGSEISTLLCYVQYKGSFSEISGPPNPDSLATHTPSLTTYPFAFEVFDAHTGNLLASGTDTVIR